MLVHELTLKKEPGAKGEEWQLEDQLDPDVGLKPWRRRSHEQVIVGVDVILSKSLLYTELQSSRDCNSAVDEDCDDNMLETLLKLACDFKYSIGIIQVDDVKEVLLSTE